MTKEQLNELALKAERLALNEIWGWKLRGKYIGLQEYMWDLNGVQNKFTFWLLVLHSEESK